MAGQGFKDFTVGEVLTSADVDGYLMQQTVMRFASSAARGSALGTAVGTAVPLAEGMVTYLDDVNSLEVYTGGMWSGFGAFSAATAIVASDASWPVPTLANPVVRVTVVGAGGGGSNSNGGVSSSRAGAGGSSTFASTAGTATATGGLGAWIIGNSASKAGDNAKDGLVASNGGGAGIAKGGDFEVETGNDGQGGEVRVAYFDMTGVSTASVTIGAGGAGSTAGETGGDGGDGVVIVEYRAG